MQTTTRYNNFLFRDLHPYVRIGTASDRFAGWTGQFYSPAMKILGDNLSGFIFEQEYHPKKNRVTPKEFAEGIDTF